MDFSSLRNTFVSNGIGKIDGGVTIPMCFSEIPVSSLSSNANRLNSSWIRAQYIIVKDAIPSSHRKSILSYWENNRSRGSIKENQYLVIHIKDDVSDDWEWYNYNGDLMGHLKELLEAISKPQIKYESNISKYLAAIRTKPFILLAGISGTGKSRIVRKLAQATITEDLQRIYDPESIKNGFRRWEIHKPANFELIQVKPNWHNSMEVVGYKSNIGGSHYEFTPFVEFLARAWQHQNIPFFLCLDEMNLAPVEQYFAEFLSAIESRTEENGEYMTDPIVKPFVDFDTKDAKGETIDYLSDRMIAHLLGALDTTDKSNLANRFKNKGLTLPKNLIIMGTVNMDETTFSFSRKVLDRAMSIEMNEVNYESFFKGETEYDIVELDKTEKDYLINRPIKGLKAGKKGADTQIEIINAVKNYLMAVNKVLDETPFKLGYRAANEALLYLSAADFFGYDNYNCALDEFTLMKILSRIEGDKRSLVTKANEPLLNALKEVITEDKFPESNKKIKTMIASLDNKQFVSYWT